MIGMKSVVGALFGALSAPTLVAPTEAFKVISWNSWGAHGNYDAFFKDKAVLQAPIILMQESTGKSAGIAQKKGYKAEGGAGGVRILFDTKTFKKASTVVCEKKIPGSKYKGKQQRDGTLCMVALQSKGKKKGGEITMAVSVHAGHNGRPSDVEKKGAAKALKYIKNMQRKFVKKHLGGKMPARVVIGGDFNEVGLTLSKKTNPVFTKKFTGKAKYTGNSHSNGKIDHLYSAGKAAKKNGKSGIFKYNFKSDHTPIFMHA